MTIDEIITALEYNTRTFPREALIRAVEEKEAITPRLLKVVEESRENIDKIYEEDDYFLHIYAFFLLAYFRETKAYRPIVQFFSTPGEKASGATGDIVTEYLGRILASTYDGDINPIKSLIENDKIDEYVRSAGVDALCILWACEVVSRDEIVDYYRSLLSGKLSEEPCFIWSSLVSRSLRLSLVELKDEINSAFDRGLIDTFFVSQSDVDRYLMYSPAEALGRFRKHDRDALVGDPVTELQGWVCFQPKDRRRSPEVSVPANPANISRAVQKPGRNDPCYCGSGRKYKKCCLLIDK